MSVRLENVWRRFAINRSGTIAIIFAMTLIPLISAVGACVDYAVALIVEVQLQNAADAAALGSISAESVAVRTAASSQTTGRITAAEADALNIANANFQGATMGAITGTTIRVDYTNNTFTSDVNLVATVPTYFMQLIGVRTLTVSATSQSKYTPVLYFNFYILVDNTPSMGLGATTADITKLENANGGCAFACHIDGSTNDAYALAKNIGAKLRIQVVASAVQSMVNMAKSKVLATDQYKMAVYSMGTSADSMGLKQLTTMTSDLDTVATTASKIDIMSIPYQGYNNDQMTDLMPNMTSIKDIIGTSGNGLSTSNPIKVLFVISDGVEDANRPTNCKKTLTGGTRCQQPLDFSACTQIKNNGVKVSVLYTTYQKIPNNGWYNSWIKPFYPEIANNMKSCSSEGLYQEVGPSGDVSATLQSLFNAVVSKTRLTV
ncbi:TadE/TadG family type IV pilus assembly protein [Oryzibacter oryziterrae]|uniref:TadE/TadG family type IV pilus assembly protein n=1 Tax=Oryzibacter oryziterrae TaxID=2766474 RepID=UPI001F38E5AD|nr:TadE/TadG family type IV pilus assembly protein [Oryzibacter oryziterrae]